MHLETFLKTKMTKSLKVILNSNNVKTINFIRIFLKNKSIISISFQYENSFIKIFYESFINF